MLAGKLSESNFPPLEGIQKGKLSHPIDKKFLILIFFWQAPMFILCFKTFNPTFPLFDIFFTNLSLLLTL
jgi:hypothetical protein